MIGLHQLRLDSLLDGFSCSHMMCRRRSLTLGVVLHNGVSKKDSMSTLLPHQEEQSVILHDINELVDPT